MWHRNLGYCAMLSTVTQSFWSRHDLSTTDFDCDLCNYCNCFPLLVWSPTCLHLYAHFSPCIDAFKLTVITSTCYSQTIRDTMCFTRTCVPITKVLITLSHYSSLLKVPHLQLIYIKLGHSLVSSGRLGNLGIQTCDAWLTRQVVYPLPQGGFCKMCLTYVCIYFVLYPLVASHSDLKGTVTLKECEPELQHALSKHARIQKVLSEGVQLRQRFFFFFGGGGGGLSLRRGGGIPIPLLAGHHRHASETPLKWRFAGVPMMAQHWMVAW